MVNYILEFPRLAGSKIKTGLTDVQQNLCSRNHAEQELLNSHFYGTPISSALALTIFNSNAFSACQWLIMTTIAFFW